MNKLLKIGVTVSGLALVAESNGIDISDLTLTDYIKAVFHVLFEPLKGVISDFLLDFLSTSRNAFINLGSTLSGVLYSDGFNIFTDNFYFWVLGVMLGTFIFIYVMKVLVNYVSALLDPM